MNNVIHLDSLNFRSDDVGYFCLNDVQSAVSVGRNPRTVEISEYLRRPETIALIAAIENTGNPGMKAVVNQRGRNGGTFVCQELVYAYAMWVCPQFHLIATREFARLNTHGVAIAEYALEDMLANPLKYFSRMIEQAGEIVERRIAK